MHLQVTPTLQSQINEIQNQLMGVVNQAGTIITACTSTGSGVSMPISTPTITTTIPQTVPQHTPVVATITTTKAKKKQVKKNGKRIDTIPTASGNVPSQIGNIQISQIDASKSSITTNKTTIENQIQITPIIDSKPINSHPLSSNTIVNSSMQQAPMHQQQQQQQQTNQSNQQLAINLQQNVQIVTAASSQQPILQHQQQSIQSTNTVQNLQQGTIVNTNAQQQQHHIQVSQQNLQMQMIQQQQPQPTIPQLTGSLSLSLVEDGRLILRHNPNLQQDTQSQVILQAILSGALCNVTLINEPLIEKTPKLNNTTSTCSVSRAIASTVSTTTNKNVVVSRIFQIIECSLTHIFRDKFLNFIATRTHLSGGRSIRQIKIEK